jgi:hypothetical protein
MVRALVWAVVVCGLVVACSEDAKTYPDYQTCFDDKFEHDQLTNVEAILACCLDHEIGDQPAPQCGATEAECINYLTANLAQTDADITVQTTACAQYVAELPQQ